jgi:hypothetical protein
VGYKAHTFIAETEIKPREESMEWQRSRVAVAVQPCAADFAHLRLPVSSSYVVLAVNLKQAVEKSKECFDKLSMNGNFSGNSNLSPFVLSASKDSERSFNRLSRFVLNEVKDLSSPRKILRSSGCAERAL